MTVFSKPNFSRRVCGVQQRLSHMILYFLFALKFFIPFTYLLFISQLTPTALKHFHSSSSHCYGEQDRSSPTPRIFILELTSVGMANITFRPQEQELLSTPTQLCFQTTQTQTVIITSPLLLLYLFVKSEMVTLVHILLPSVLFVMNNITESVT